MRPSLFIGSSVESIRIAKAVQTELAYDVDATVWDQGIFTLSRDTLESLLEASQNYDYALFILSGDDIVLLRKELKVIARDNVMFELGLFFGALGKERCFFMVPSNIDDFHIPTDLAGITPAKFDPTSHGGNLAGVVAVACNRIREAISRYHAKGVLSGKWRQTWSMIEGEEVKNFPSESEVSHVGNEFRARFNSLNRTYIVTGNIEYGNMITGIWRDIDHSGATYYGSFQLKIFPFHDKMEGKWLGWGVSGGVREGNWIWERLPETK
jgi:Predicted nucleotide-binding protein containing TIR-like domain